jgi:hypothetical protein
MKPVVSFMLLAAALLAPLDAVRAAAPDLSRITSRADLDAAVAATPDPVLKAALTDHAPAILAAVARHPHVEAVIRTIEKSPGTFTKINTTPEALKKAAGGDIAVFDTLSAVSTAILGGHAHQNRDKQADPYDAAFIEHLGHIDTLESVAVVVTTLEESWLDPLLGLPRLKSLRIEKRGGGGLGDSALEKLARLEKLPELKSLALHYFTLTDAGLERLAGLKNLETFSLRANVPGHAFAKFAGWTNLKSIAFHGNGIDDEGFGYICERFPNLESLNLIHARQLTDASAVHLPKLTKLKSILINGPKITAAWLRPATGLPIESLNIAEGAVRPPAEVVATITSIPTLRRLSLWAGGFSDADLDALAKATQLESLAIDGLDLPAERQPHLRGFSFLKSLSLIRYGTGYPDDVQAAIKGLLPTVDVRFVK